MTQENTNPIFRQYVRACLAPENLKFAICKTAIQQTPLAGVLMIASLVQPLAVNPSRIVNVVEKTGRAAAIVFRPQPHNPPGPSAAP